MTPATAPTDSGPTPIAGGARAGIQYRPRGHVVAVQYPADPDPAREVEIRGLARQLGMVPDEPFDYSRYNNGRQARPSKEILLKRTGRSSSITVPRGHWFVVHPRPGGPLFEVLSDPAFRAAFDGPQRGADGERDLAAAVAAEAHWQLGRQVELRVLDANDYTTGAWAHPAMQAVIADIRAQLHHSGAELWEHIDAEDHARWELNQTRLPVPVRVRPQLRRHGEYYPSSARHAVPSSDVRGSRTHPAGRVLCETGARSAPLAVGPITVAPPDCPRCLTHLRAIAERHGQQLAEPPPSPQPPPDQSNQVSREVPAAAADLPDLGEGWRLVQYNDPDRWWLHHHDRIRGYTHQYTTCPATRPAGKRSSSSATGATATWTPPAPPRTARDPASCGAASPSRHGAWPPTRTTTLPTPPGPAPGAGPGGPLSRDPTTDHTMVETADVNERDEETLRNLPQILEGIVMLDRLERPNPLAGRHLAVEQVPVVLAENQRI